MKNDNEASFFLVLWFGVSQACLNTEKQSWLEEQALWPIVSGRCLALYTGETIEHTPMCTSSRTYRTYIALLRIHTIGDKIQWQIYWPTKGLLALIWEKSQRSAVKQTVFILLDSWFSNIWYLVFVFCVCLLVFLMSCCCVIMRIVSADNRVLTGSMSFEGRLQKNAYFTPLGLRGTVFSCLNASHTPEPDWKLSGLPWPPRTPIQAAI